MNNLLVLNLAVVCLGLPLRFMILPFNLVANYVKLEYNVRFGDPETEGTLNLSPSLEIHDDLAYFS